MKNMKYLNLLKLQCMALLMLGGLFISSCTEDDMTVGTVDEKLYEFHGDLLGYLTDSQGKQLASNVEFRSSGDLLLYLNLTKKTTSDCAVSVVYDENVLEDYNVRNSASYELFPQSQVMLPEEAVLEVKAGEKKSSPLQISFVSNGELSMDKKYVIPLKINVISGNLDLVQEENTWLVFVTDKTGMPDCNKASGVKIFSCMEVNDTNPLNNLSFTLKNSKKLLIDALIMFSGNMMYNRETGQVTMKYNANVQALLDKNEHYLKPLQDHGMKVFMGIMPDHDGSGLCNLAPETCREFALEIKAMCDAYNLDGIFLDEEYADYNDYNLYLTVPGFVRPAASACSRLAYEVHKLQPEKDIVVYAYGTIFSLPSIYVDGRTIQSGEYVTYAVRDYGVAGNMSSSFPGLPKSNMGLYSQEYTGRFIAKKSQLQWMVDGGYKTHMIFAMDPYRLNFEYQQLPSMQDIAEVFFDDELVYDGVKYPKDWE